MRPKLSSLASTGLAVFGEREMMTITPRTPSPESSMEVETLGFGGVSLLRGQDDCSLSKSFTTLGATKCFLSCMNPHMFS